VTPALAAEQLGEEALALGALTLAALIDGDAAQGLFDVLAAASPGGLSAFGASDTLAHAASVTRRFDDLTGVTRRGLFASLLS
jgi:hypothetical protein